MTPVASASPRRAPAATAALERHKGPVSIPDAGTGRHRDEGAAPDTSARAVAPGPAGRRCRSRTGLRARGGGRRRAFSSTCGRFRCGRMTRVKPQRCAASTLSRMPPTGSNLAEQNDLARHGQAQRLLDCLAPGRERLPESAPQHRPDDGRQYAPLYPSERLREVGLVELGSPPGATKRPLCF